MDKDLGRRDKGDPPPARTRVHAGPATLRRRLGVTWSWSLGQKGDTAKLLFHVDKLVLSAEGFYKELNARKAEGRAKPHRFRKLANSGKKKLAPW